MVEAPMQTANAAVEASIRQFYSLEAKAAAAEARASAAEVEAAKCKGQAEVLAVQRVRDAAEISQLRGQLAEIDLIMRHVAGDFMTALEQMRIGGYRRPGSRTSTEVIDRVLADGPKADEAKAAINGLRAVENELSGEEAAAEERLHQDETAELAKTDRHTPDERARRQEDAERLNDEETGVRIGARHGANNRPQNWNEPLPPMPLPRNRPPDRAPRSKLLEGLLSSASALNPVR